ncbi:MAG: RusA family crossover junction endodeoxyribonuclease [Saccharofermentans sp.]|nr:RusA family crossover junction endodeoxyribonuclease [Saccharofermentans sp.]
MEFFMPMRIPTATAQEKKINTKTGTIYPDASVKAAKEKYLAHLDRFKPDTRIKAPIMLMVIFYFHSDEHPDKSPKITKPDTDNMIKLLKDCMTKKGFWKDDAHVTYEIIGKYWTTGTEGIYIKVNNREEV